MTRMLWVYKMHDAERRGDGATANRIRSCLMKWPMEVELPGRAPYRPGYLADVLSRMPDTPPEMPDEH